MPSFLSICFSRISLFAVNASTAVRLAGDVNSEATGEDEEAAREDDEGLTNYWYCIFVVATPAHHHIAHTRQLMATLGYANISLQWVRTPSEAFWLSGFL